MIDFNNITKFDLWWLGITIQDQKKFEEFVEFVLEELEVRIGDRLSKELSNEELEEFDSIKNVSEAGEWLATHMPNCNDMICEEQYRLVWDMVKNRKKYSDVDVEDPLLLSEHIASLDLSQHNYKCLCDANLLKLKDVVDFNNLLSIKGMDSIHEKEVIIKIVDYLFKMID